MSESGIQVEVARARSGAGAGTGAGRAPQALDEAAVRAALTEVMDPELPMLSVVDLGILHRVEVAPGDGSIRVEILPTFVGCPALELIKRAIAARLAAFGRPVEVTATFEIPWTSERITPAGHDALLAAGIAPPGADSRASVAGGLIDLEPCVPCPNCGSRRTTLENVFGPTPCRTIRHCADCRQPFEAIKPV
ncbi:MAG: 1,2-phenylacetyl-CoA epoxidase subunit PaaD [Chloroflexota bacterium]